MRISYTKFKGGNKVNKVYMLVIPEKLHYKLKMIAAGEKTTMRDLITRSIEKFVGGKVNGNR